MGKAGKSLKQVLTQYGISQNRLACLMGTNRSTVHQWVNEISDPLAEAVTNIVKALQEINHSAAEDFINGYLDRPTAQPERMEPSEQNLTSTVTMISSTAESPKETQYSFQN